MSDNKNNGIDIDTCAFCNKKAIGSCEMETHATRRNITLGCNLDFCENHGSMINVT